MQSFPSQQDSINGDLLSTMEIQQLIRQCQQGDAEALGALYQTYAQRMRGVCRRYICPPPLSKTCATPIASSGNWLTPLGLDRGFLLSGVAQQKKFHQLILVRTN